MSILECLYGNPSERAAKLNERFRKVVEIQEQSLSSHPMAAPLNRRTSTLRVRTIRWKGRGLWDIDAHKLFNLLALQGAQVKSRHEKGLYGVWWYKSAEITWPEARK